MIDDELRAYFLASARPRVVEIDAALDALTGDVEDPDARQVLAKHFHALAGLGGTYGFPRLSEIGDALEGALLDVTRGRAELTQETIAHWRELMAEIARELC
ncbi:MAG: Hpt domain-containing protein [Acidobacteriota bacterium]|nr:Hpt domain-containing protein [Acidobacteriota bacterium]